MTSSVFVSVDLDGVTHLAGSLYVTEDRTKPPASLPTTRNTSHKPVPIRSNPTCRSLRDGKSSVAHSPEHCRTPRPTGGGET